MSERRQTVLIALLLGVVGFTSVFIAQRHSGIARDEIDYLNAGNRYAKFWGELVSMDDGAASKKNITAHFGGKRATDNNREHPPLLKTLFGLSKRVFADGLGITSELSAYRLPTALFNAVLVALVFVFVGSLWGRAEGVLAALLTLLMPRAFFHAGLATFDAAVVAMWMATVFAYYKALDSRWWCVALGLVYGLALATKHNAIFLPVPLLVHYIAICVIEVRRDKRRGASFGEKASAVFREIAFRRPLILVALGGIGPLVLIALWPWLWFDTVSHLGDWIGFHLKHVHYNFEYLGENWNAPPFPVHVPIVTTLLTVPVITIAGALLGTAVLVVRARNREAPERHRAPALLLFLSAGAAMGPFILRTTPIFGAEKHFAAAFPTIAIFAAIGIVFAARRFARRLSWYVPLSSPFHKRLEPIAVIGLAVLSVTAAFVETIDAQPYALSHYNALAGGAPGGADLGMNRQFWGVSSRGTLPELNRLGADFAAKDKSGKNKVSVYAHDADKTFGVYHRLGLLDRRIKVAPREMGGIRASQIAIVIHELHFNRHDYLIWTAYGSVKPVWVLRTDGVPIVSVYARALPSSAPEKAPKGQ